MFRHKMGFARLSVMDKVKTTKPAVPHKQLGTAGFVYRKIYAFAPGITKGG